MKWHPIAPNGVYCDPNCGGITTRDTSITQDPVTKQWLLFYTSGTNYFSWAYSSNLINWAYGGTVSTAAAGSVTGTGAPEAFWDSDGTFHVFVAVGFGADSAHNYQIYETHPTTAHNYSSWSAPVALSGNWAANVTNSSNIMVIDPFMVKIGSTYYLWYADGSAAQAGGYMTYATSSNVMGPYTRATAAGDWAGWGANNDGETLVQVDTNKWSICFEDLNDDYWCSTSTSGFTGWSPKAKPSSPIKLRHGTIVPIYSMDTLRQVTAASLSWMDYGRNSGLPLPSGYIGETISNSFCANSGMSNGNALNITSITVPSGVWLVTGTAGLNTNGSITVTYANGGTSNSSATSPNTGNRWDYPGTITVNGALEFATPTQTINTASPMTLYQVIAANFSGSGTAGGCGAITARRLQ
ncbi:hypothetical protein M2322_002697 [Rhodoblastus acidophilus]|uniref:hypothetical protein n=1 Tax=Rhodoblastus acidophilus TaxID=1074 RepID=UPI002224F238|nr:hypothetical protein [Rhodoblastus acidophilus]MCW2317143.1 hypothetical protein [Rhodoblastus acidophilus]